MTVTDTNVSDTKAILANITDPYMGRIELTEFPPESLHHKAIRAVVAMTMSHSET